MALNKIMLRSTCDPLPACILNHAVCILSVPCFEIFSGTLHLVLATLLQPKPSVERWLGHMNCLSLVEACNGRRFSSLRIIYERLTTSDHRFINTSISIRKFAALYRFILQKNSPACRKRYIGEMHTLLLSWAYELRSTNSTEYLRLGTVQKTTKKSQSKNDV